MDEIISLIVTCMLTMFFKLESRNQQNQHRFMGGYSSINPVLGDPRMGAWLMGEGTARKNRQILVRKEEQTNSGKGKEDQMLGKEQVIDR